MKHFHITILLAILIGMVGTKVVAQDGNYDVEVDGIYYRLDSGDATVVNPNGDNMSSGYSGYIEIPSSIVVYGEDDPETWEDESQIDYFVKAIGDNAFAYSDITSISIPYGVVNIGMGAFYECRNLTSITIPYGVEGFGWGAFSGCSNLTSIELPSSLKEIGNWVFAGCTKLSSIMIPNGVTEICEQAFKECTSLTSVTIPSSVTNIGDEAFYECQRLSSVMIPSSVTSIGSEAFQGCSWLNIVEVGWSEPLPQTSGLFPGHTDVILYVPVGSKAAYEAADYWKDFKEIKETIVFDDTNVRYLCIANWDTNGDGELSEAEAAAVTNLGTVFKNNTTITSFDELQYFTGLTSIDNSAFLGCSGLTSVTIPSSVTHIGNEAFSRCYSLTSVTIPEGVMSMGQAAFQNCSSLTSVVIPSSMTSIGYAAFLYSGIYTNSPNGVFYVDKWVCGYKGSMPTNKSITLDDGTLGIADWAFDSCSGLISVTIPSSITSIGYSAFYGCTGLTSVDIPNSVTSIGSRAFYGCTGLTSVSVEWVEPIAITSDVFSNRTNATLYVPAGSKAAYEAADYWKEFNEIVEMAPPSPIIEFADANVKAICVANWDTDDDGELSEAEAEEVTNLGTVFKNNNTITSFNELQYFTGLTIIPNNAFYQCNSLTSIIIPNSVTSIERNALWGCSSLTSIEIPNSVTSIEDMAFYGCSSLNKVIVKDIAAWCKISFMSESSNPLDKANHLYSDENTEIKNLVIPNSVTSIGSYAFCFCTGLTSVEIPNSVTSIGNGVFAHCSGITSVEIPNSVMSIGNEVFAYCSGLTSVEIPNSVTSIGRNTFRNCYALSSVEIPNSVMTIGKSAFYESGITSVSIGNSVTSIDDDAFYGCSDLDKVIVKDIAAWCKISFYDESSNPLSYAKHLYSNENTEITDLVIPSSVTNIGNYSFWGFNGLTTITIPNSVTSIGYRAFRNCHGLSSVTIPNSVTTIGEEAFCGCIGLTSINIPAGVTSIGGYAFYGCNSLNSVTVDSSSPIVITENVFSNRTNATLYVPSGCKSAYEAADYWKDFKEIVEIEPQKYTLEIEGLYDGDSHLYDRDGNEYDVTDFSSNEFNAGSYIRISPFIPASLYISEIIVNGESVGTWTDENTAPTDYVIESLSENTTVEFKTYLREQWRYLHCVADGPGNIEMYKNGNYVGITTYNEDFQINIFTELFEEGDVMKLVFIPDAGCTLTDLSGGEYTGFEDIDLTGNIVDNTFIFTFSPDDIVNEYGYLVRSFAATFEGPEPQTDNVLSATATTILTGQEASLSLYLTNEDEIIMTEFYMQLPDGITIEEDEDGYPIVTINSERENKHVIEVSRNSEGLYHFLCYSSKNNAFKGNEGELFNMNLICAEGVTAGSYTATVKDIIMSDIYRNEITQDDFTFNITVLDVAMGDANGDGRINGMDIVEMVDYIMERPSNTFVFAAADLTGDGKVNGMDLVELVSLVMAQGAQAPSSALPRREGTLQIEKLDEGALTLNGNGNGGVMLGVENNDEFILAQMIVEVSDGFLTDITTDKAHVATWSPIGENKYAVLAYSTRNRSFTTNDCLLTFLGCEGNITVKDVMLVDANREAKFFADVVYNGTTGIEPTPNPSLKGRENIYDLNGRKLETRNMELGTSPKGVYIVNGKKVVIK